MSIGHFTSDYLKKWLKIIADSGYDSVVWEPEDAVQWETCPECVASEAFTKAEFKEILAYGTSLGLKHIPLLQTMSHCEYVLKQKAYQHLSEHPGFLELYCPLNPEVHKFLNRWIAEYLELFGDVTHFHLGADEAWALGGRFCEGSCPDYMKSHSKAELYSQHIMKVAKPLLEKNITPIIWADMLLKHPEALKLLSRDILLFDWMYEVRNDVEKVWIWEKEKGYCSSDEIPEGVKAKYKKYLYPEDRKGGLDPFYTASLLKDHGFPVVGCPASSSYGDNVFAPRHGHHMANTAGWTEQYVSGKTTGFTLTSWTVHLFPYEMQLSSILIPSFLIHDKNASMKNYETYFTKHVFGEDLQDFFKATELLSGKCLFSYTSTLGFSTCHHVVKNDHIAITLDKLSEKGGLERELENCREQLMKYKNALDMFKQMKTIVGMGHELLDIWILQAENLINRARASSIILENKIAEMKREIPSFKKKDVREVLVKLSSLKLATSAMYDGRIKPTRIKQVISWMYDAVESELLKISDKIS